MLARFNMTNAKFVVVSLVAHFIFFDAQCHIKDENKWTMSKILHDSALESFIYLITYTRSDISLAISKLRPFKRQLNLFLDT